MRYSPTKARPRALQEKPDSCFLPDPYELLRRGDYPIDDAADAAHDSWDRAIIRYNRRWARIKHAFPASVRRFDATPICLHDAELLSMARNKDRLILVLRQEPPSRDLVILTFTLDGEFEIDTSTMPPNTATNRVFWMYEEFDLDCDKRCRFEVMLTNGWIVKLHFRKFQYVVAEAVNLATASPTLPTARPG